jgi:hypothetical protein
LADVEMLAEFYYYCMQCCKPLITIMNGFEDLEVWKKCREFRIEISESVKKFPVEEKYRLVDQLIRASR